MRPRGKLFDLSNNDDIEAVLDILDESDAYFSEDDDADEILTALNVNTGAESSDDSISSEDLFAFPNDQLSEAVEQSNSIEQPSTSKQTSIGKSNTLNRPELWKNISFQNTELPTTSSCQNYITSKTPLEYFKNYFPESHYQDVKYTKMYVMGKSGEEVRYVPTDIKRFYGCSIIMGCLGYPAIIMYWSNECNIPAIFNSMSRDKFL
ncbi:hypothetical protein CVS40_10436 [Lucilia cuprina]|nr:hypothetical protein CVS40_10436 [Lucilia cuprina]